MSLDGKDVNMIVKPSIKEKEKSPVTPSLKRKRRNTRKPRDVPSNSQKFSDVLDELKEVRKEISEIKACVLRSLEIQKALVRHHQPRRFVDINSYLHEPYIPMVVDDKEFGNDKEFLKDIFA